ncbi:hypothetical protein U1Q18_035729 [Sarracenia purpurea var. burkii]
MDGFSNPYGTNQTMSTGGRKLEVINGANGYAVTRVYGVRRSLPLNPPPLSTQSGGFAAIRRASPPSKAAASKPKRWFNGGELQRRKRIAKYKWYAVEGKVKASLKDGFRWLKRRCSQIVHGF